MWRLLVLALLLTIVYFVIKFALRGLRGQEKKIEKPARPAGLPSEMMQDPVCGLFVPKEGAICLRRDEQTVFFCSDTCRTAYQKQIDST